MARKPKAASRYALHPSYAMAESAIAKLLADTGRSYADWVKLIERHGPPGAAARRKWLREEHGLRTNVAWWVAAGENMDPAAYNPEELVDAQYAGARAALRPIYELLLKVAFALGDDVNVCPCATMVPLYRKHVFASITAATNARIDLRLALGVGAKTHERVEALKRHAPGDRLTHRIALTSVDDVDEFVVKWMRAALARGNTAADHAPTVTAGHETAVPKDLAAALKASARAKATFAALTPRMRAHWISWIGEAAKAATRTSRIARAVERLAQGKKGPY